MSDPCRHVSTSISTNCPDWMRSDGGDRAAAYAVEPSEFIQSTFQWPLICIVFVFCTFLIIIFVHDFIFSLLSLRLASFLGPDVRLRTPRIRAESEWLNERFIAAM